MIYLAYILGLILLSQVLSELIVLFYPIRKLANTPLSPSVSILTSVRNEEKSLEQCLQSLLNQDYPDFEVWVANDASSDSTPTILQSFSNRMNFNFLTISDSDQRDNVNPKAQNLEKLSQLARGEYLAVADGDCVYPESWLRNMMNKTGQVKLVSGVTGIEGSRMEDLDWKINTGRIAVLSGMGFNTSAVGNNMIVERKSLDEVGGWKAVMNHLTEDFALHRLFYKARIPTGIRFEPGAIVKSTATPLRKRFNQRKRWMKGVNELSLITRFMVYLQSFLLPAILTGFLFFPRETGIGLVVFLLLKVLSNLRLLSIIKETQPYWKTIFDLIAYQLHQLIFNFLFLIYQVFGPRVRWKGRKY